MMWRPARLTREQVEERRMEGARLILEGHLTQAAIARQLGVSRTAVKDWAQRLKAGGLAQLRGRQSSGRPSKLSPSQWRELERCLKRGARAAGFETDRWTMPRVRQVIQHELGIEYHPKYLNRLLRKMNGSPQVPLPRAVEHDGPRIKKAQRRGVSIVFFDEFGFSYQEGLAHTWAPTGRRPVLRRIESERRAISTAVGLTLSGHLYKRHYAGSRKSDHVMEALKHLLRHIPQGFILVWDRAQTHTSKLTTAYLAQPPNILVEQLPAYAPELNSEEYGHGNIKRRLKNTTPANPQEIRHMLDRGFARLRRRPDLLLSFVHQAGLGVKQLRFP